MMRWLEGSLVLINSPTLCCLFGTYRGWARLKGGVPYAVLEGRGNVYLVEEKYVMLSKQSERGTES
jgi:hypothetical protein